MTKYDDLANWRNRVKRKLIEYKGGKCEKCGYDKCNRALDFHHRNPSKKDFSISATGRGFERMKKEVDKCSLVCSNCHREIHDQLISEKRIKRMELQRKFLKENICFQCKKKFKPRKIEQKYCSIKCRSLSKRKGTRPRKKTLAKMLENMSWCAIGRKYNVSDNAVRKWAKIYNLL